MTTPTDFLLARIAEDEVRASGALARRWFIDVSKRQIRILADGIHRVGSAIEPSTAEHIARHDPARVLAECEAKRRIVELWRLAQYPNGDPHGALQEVVEVLAAIYADHPDYRDEWRVR